MKKNMGITDKVLRLLAAALLIVLYFTNVVTGTWGIVMLAIAGLLIVTSLFSICPMYYPLRISTLKKKDA